MNKQNFWTMACAALLTFVLSGLVKAASAAAGSGPPQHSTEVIAASHPAIPQGQTRTGSCWTHSLASRQRDAWRCTTKNLIYDPCFETPQLSGGVVCDWNPATHKPGFVLKLTKPLPSPRSSRNTSKFPPWLIKLSDGSVCEKETGTADWINEQPLIYGCSDSHCLFGGCCSDETELAPDFKRRGKIWMAEKFRFKRSGDCAGKTTILKREWIPVDSLWE